MPRTITLFMLLVFVNVTHQDENIKAKLNGTVKLKFPPGPEYQRYVVNPQTKLQDVQVYRVCNGKNKNTCGYWESMETKKKVASGKTTYNKTTKLMTIKNLKKSDQGQYLTAPTHYSVYIP